MKRLAIIGGGVMATYFGESCHRLGIESHYFSQKDGEVSDTLVDFFHEINIFDKDGIVNICKDLGVSGVVATTELTVFIAAYVADRLGLLGNPVDVAFQITDKYRNRKCIEELTDLLSPDYMEVSSIADIRNSNLSYPIILKPVNLGGKRGLSVIYNESQLLLGFEYAKSCFPEGVTPKIIAEQFLEGGVECSVESISFKGIHTIVQITQKDSGGAPHCVELGHHQPAQLSSEIWNKVVRGVTDGLTAIGLTNGACHTEVKIIEDKVFLIEFNARPGGDHIACPMVELSTGYDYISGIVLAAIGEFRPIDRNTFKNYYSGIYYVVKQTSHLWSIFEDCESQKWCKEKNFVTDELIELTKNDMEHTNYMIYASAEGDPIKKLLKRDD